MTEQTNHNEAGEVAPSADSPEATDIPTSNAPDPKAANPDTNPNAAKTTTAPPKREKPAAAAKAADGEKPAAKAAKKENHQQLKISRFQSLSNNITYLLYKKL